MEEKKRERIGELSRKQRSVGLTEEEKAEQAALREEYLSLIRRNFSATIEQLSWSDPDGEIHTPKKRK